MNAAIDHAAALGDIHDFIECCEAHGWFYSEGWISLQTAVDNLQHLAERWGLVDEIGQDQIQSEIASALDARQQPDPRDLPSDYAVHIVRQWEMADPRDRWRHTGEPPPEPKIEPSAPKPYRPPQATVDAFWFVVRLDDPEYLARWLAQHPADAPHLHEIWERRCSTEAA
jgi:hypothetical protein